MKKNYMENRLPISRRAIAESFVMFGICAVCALAYLHIRPYAYPDLAETIYWVFLAYAVVLLAAYHLEVAAFLLRVWAVCAINIANRLRLPIRDRIAASIIYTRAELCAAHAEYTTVELVIRGVRAVFQVLLAVFLLTLLVRELYPGATEWININYFIILVTVFGIASVLTNDEDQDACEPVTMAKRDYLVIGAASIAGTGVVWYRIQDIGKLAYLIAILSGALIFLLSVLVLKEDDEEQHNSTASDVSQRGEV